MDSKSLDALKRRMINGGYRAGITTPVILTGIVDMVAPYAVPKGCEIAQSTQVMPDDVFVSLEILCESVEEAYPFLVQHEQSGYPTEHLETVRAWIDSRTAQ